MSREPGGDLTAELRSLAAISGLLTTLDYEEMLRGVVRAALDIVGASRGFLFLAGDDGLLSVRIGMDAKGRELGSGETPDFCGTLVRRAVKDKRCLHVPDVSASAELSIASSVARLRIGSALCLPLVAVSRKEPEAESRVAGVIYLDRPDAGRPLGPRETALFQALANLAAAALANASIHRDAVRENSRLVASLKRRGLLVGECPAMQTLFEASRRVAPSSAGILVVGETGTGKESVARLVHDLSDRREGPYVVVDCTALPRELVESELFGHEKGAYTGATDARRGLIESADGGTLFLDEITELPAEAQSKLLRFLQEGEVRRVGAQQARRVDARVVAATNRDPEAESRAGRLRPDLYYRLRVVTLRVPPLRERGEDVVRLARHFLETFSREEGRRFDGFTPAAENALRAEAWPGNVRDLEHRVRRAVLFAPGSSVGANDLELGAASSPPAGAGLKAVLDRVEKEEVERSLQEARGNVSAAAKRLEIGRSTLQDLMRRHAISRDRFGDAP
jgi:DNA-binding NtrC family response regulator